MSENDFEAGVLEPIKKPRHARRPKNYDILQNLERQYNARLRECGRDHASAMRLIDWLQRGAKEPAYIAFTEGPERQIAYAVEQLLMKL